MAGHFEQPDHLPGRELGYDDDAVGTVRVRPRERWIISLDFAAGSFRMEQEVQIVNRNDLSGGTGRHEQRM
jgi:hypothetical protein